MYNSFKGGVKLRRRLSVLLSFIMLFCFLSTQTFAMGEIISTNKVIEINKVGYEITTEQGIIATVKFKVPVSTSCSMYLKMYTTEFANINGEYPGVITDKNGNILDTKLDKTNDRYNMLWVENNGESTTITIPIAAKVYYVSNASISVWIDDPINGAYFVDTCQFGNKGYQQDNSSSDTSDDSSDSSTTLDNSIIKDEVSEVKTEPTYYLKSADIIASDKPIVFVDIESGTKEFDMINNLAYKGIIVQASDKFDLTKEVSTEEAFTYLSKLLVVNEAVDSKLSVDIVEKYLDKDSDNFPYLATIGSMLTEDTLKVVSATKTMTREIFAEVLKDVTNLELEEKENTFIDIEESSYKEALKYCYNTGLLIGTTENTMSPKDTITNVQMLNVLSRLDNILSKKM